MTINTFVETAYRKIKKILIISSVDGINIRKIFLRKESARGTRGCSTVWNHIEGVLRSLSTSGK